MHTVDAVKEDWLSLCYTAWTKHVQRLVQTGKSKTTPWGSGYRPAPPLLHGMSCSACTGCEYHVSTCWCMAILSGTSTSYFQSNICEMGKIKVPAWFISQTLFVDVFIIYCLSAGYKRIVTGENASERLDMRAAVKADKFCK